MPHDFFVSFFVLVTVYPWHRSARYWICDPPHFIRFCSFPVPFWLVSLDYLFPLPFTQCQRPWQWEERPQVSLTAWWTAVVWRRQPAQFTEREKKNAKQTPWNKCVRGCGSLRLCHYCEENIHQNPSFFFSGAENSFESRHEYNLPFRSFTWKGHLVISGGHVRHRFSAWNLFIDRLTLTMEGEGNLLLHVFCKGHPSCVQSNS